MTFAPQPWDRDPDSCTYLLWAIQAAADAAQKAILALLTFLRELLSG